MSARKKKYYRDNIKEWQDATNRRLFRKIVAFAALTSIVPGAQPGGPGRAPLPCSPCRTSRKARRTGEEGCPQARQ